MKTYKIAFDNWRKQYSVSLNIKNDFYTLFLNKSSGYFSHTTSIIDHYYFDTYKEAENALLNCFIELGHFRIGSIFSKKYISCSQVPNERYLWKNGTLNKTVFDVNKKAQNEGHFNNNREMLVALADFFDFKLIIKIEKIAEKTITIQDKKEEIDVIIKDLKMKWEEIKKSKLITNYERHIDRALLISSAFERVLQNLSNKGNKKATRVIDEVKKLIKDL
jgi:hypothetical protein